MTQPTATRLTCAQTASLPWRCAQAMWHIRWAALRLMLAGFLLFAFVRDGANRLERLAFMHLPDYDYIAEVIALRQVGRYDEAILVAEAGREELQGEELRRLESEVAATVAERDSWLRRARELGVGALIGEGRSTEALIGAVGADFFVVGDIRDLLIQGARQVVDGDCDEVVLALSGLGVATTLCPQGDWVPALLKVAWKTGSMTKKLAMQIVSLVKKARATGDATALARLMGDVGEIAAHAKPGGAMRLLRHADDVDDVARIAGFLRREKSAAFTLHAAGDEGVQAIRTGGRAAEDALIQAAKKKAGAAWLRTAGQRALRPHPLLGIAKSVWKGNLPRLVQQTLPGWLDRYGWLVVPLLTLWFLAESGLIWRRLAAAASHLSRANPVLRQVPEGSP